jgi:hypothetical protein
MGPDDHLDSTLEKQPSGARHPYLIFSSVGDRSSLHHWLRGRENFDLWVTYYGSRPGHFRDEADYYNTREGSKYQNLHYVYGRWGHLIARYSAVLVMDDDIVISGSQISRLFELRQRYDLWALQPAFSPRGKISWPVTRADRRNVLRFTNFIEMTCPLFRRDKLDAFMAVYHPELIGWGCDWWFLEVLGDDLRDRVAVVDEITCVNPHDSTKAGREIDRLAVTSERKAAWERIRTKYGIRSESRGIAEYGAIAKPGLGRYRGQLMDAAEAVWLRLCAAGRWPVRVVRRLRALTLRVTVLPPADPGG